MAKVKDLKIGDVIKITGAFDKIGLNVGQLWEIVEIKTYGKHSGRLYTKSRYVGQKDDQKWPVNAIEDIWYVDDTFEYYDEFAHWVHEVRAEAGV